MLTKAEENRIFNEACNGYGFVEVEQSPDGIYCAGCLTVHKRPAKMYSNRRDESWCKSAIIRFWNPEDNY